MASRPALAHLPDKRNGSGTLPNYVRRPNVPTTTTIAVKQAAAPTDSGVGSVIRVTAHRIIVRVMQTKPMILDAEYIATVRVPASTHFGFRGLFDGG